MNDASAFSGAVVVLGKASDVVSDEAIPDRRAVGQTPVEWGSTLDCTNDLDSLAREVDELRLENQILKAGVTVDSRTGLPNEVAFNLDHLWLYAARGRSAWPYTLLLAEVDSAYDASERRRVGPGDPAVAAVAHRIRDTVRQGDRAYHYGGDKFAMLLAGTELAKAVVAAERVRSNVEALGIDFPAHPSGRVTVTIAVIEAGFRHETAKDLIAEVNVLLLEGQNAGRNRIAWQSSPPSGAGVGIGASGDRPWVLPGGGGF